MAFESDTESENILYKGQFKEASHSNSSWSSRCISCMKVILLISIGIIIGFASLWFYLSHQLSQLPPIPTGFEPVDLSAISHKIPSLISGMPNDDGNPIITLLRQAPNNTISVLLDHDSSSTSLTDDEKDVLQAIFNIYSGMFNTMTIR